MPVTFEQSASEITRSSGSNLAFALACLPRDKRRDMDVIYAWCRVVDDIADDPGLAVSEKREALDAWRQALAANDGGRGPLDDEVKIVRAKYHLGPEHFVEILDGVAMDFDKKRYASFDELMPYCYRVASAVGLITIEIFGYRDPACREYATQLGYALQLTNILRDVAEDIRSDGRIYLPGNEMEAAAYSEEDLKQEVYDQRFLRLMTRVGDEADTCFARAREALPDSELRSMRCAELMKAIYGDVFARMKRDGFKVFERRYRPGKCRMIYLLLKARLGAVKF